ncbi:MAG: hypothetical protein QXS20_08435 [Candidatus Thorarchaeota archaeon]
MMELLGNQFPALLHSVLNRLPVVVVGADIELIDEIVDSVAALCPHRHKLVFWRDFTTDAEILDAHEEERHDHEVVRTVVCSMSASFRLLTERISTFVGWIIAVPIDNVVMGTSVTEEALADLLEHIESTSENCGIVRVISPSVIRFGQLKECDSSLTVERTIVAKILENRNQALERIRRILSRSLHDTDLPEPTMMALLQLDDEAEKVVRDMFEEEISRYVHAARRALTILSRIRILRELGARATLAERNLFEAIGWSIGGLDDMMRFMKSEWYEDFSDCIRGSGLLGLGEWVESMWGG